MSDMEKTISGLSEVGMTILVPFNTRPYNSELMTMVEIWFEFVGDK